ncbi:MAG TPA: sigma-70 family RNA polymerase sigma factor [Bacteroidota bacterium]|nr:sigma-70 family RNA polymerase sigma factor [Bacteroidota bacterium]
MDIISDIELLEQLRRGDTIGLSHLYTRYRERLQRYCTGLLKDRDVAEDVVQNVFLKLHTGQDSIRNGQALERWLFTVARNEAYTFLVRKKPLPLDESIIWEGDSPEDELMLKQRHEIVDAVVQRLHVAYREVIMLRIYEQLSYEEIAEITGTTIPSVKSRLFKARKALINQLQPVIDCERM